MHTITFYAYKGGTGRSLALANVATYLALFGQRVVAIDFDLEAPGLHHKLTLGRNITAEPAAGVVDYIHGYAFGGRVQVKDLAVEVAPVRGAEGSILLIPAGCVPSPHYWRQLAEIDWHALFYEPDAVGAPLFLELKEEIRTSLKPDFLLIDARTGITEMGGVAIALLPDSLVCFLLNNRENLEGARAVLRSAKAPRPALRRNGINTLVVLSRIPDVLPDAERELSNQVVAYLNEPANPPDVTLSLKEVFVLHSEPELQFAEHLHIGQVEGQTGELLRDYLRLFASLIDPELVKPHLGKLIERAKGALFEDPDASQKELENIARYFGHPEAYRELIRLYRVRNAPPGAFLQTAEGLWEITRDASEQLLWEIVRKHFKEVGPWIEDEGEDGVSLRFVEAVWTAQGGNDVEVGCNLAESLDNFGDRNHAADLLLRLVRRVGANSKAVTQCITQLLRANRVSEALGVIDQYKEQLATSDEFLVPWARAELARDSSTISSELQAVLDRVFAIAPLPGAQLLQRAGRVEELNRWLMRAMDHATRRGRVEELADLGMAFGAVGLGEQFELLLRRGVQDRKAQLVRTQLNRRFVPS